MSLEKSVACKTGVVDFTINISSPKCMDCHEFTLEVTAIGKQTHNGVVMLADRQEYHYMKGDGVYTDGSPANQLEAVNKVVTAICDAWDEAKAAQPNVFEAAGWKITH